MYDLFNYLVENKNKGFKNYSDKDFDMLLSTQLFDRYNKVFQKYKIDVKIDEISVRTSQVR